MKLTRGINSIASLLLSLSLTHTASAWVSVPSNATLIYSPNFQSASITNFVNGTGNWNGTISGGAWGHGVPTTNSRATDYINYIVTGNKTLSDYVNASIGPDTVPWGPYPESVLKLTVNKTDPDQSAISRFQYNWFPNSSIKDIYIVEYVKIQNNLLQVMPDQGASMWRSFFEVNETPASGEPQHLRAEVTINRKQNNNGTYDIGWLGNVSYLSHVNGVPSTFASVPGGYFFNTSTPIPVGKWFQLTIHYKLDQTNGAFEAAIWVCKDGGGFEGDQQNLFSFKNIKTATGQTNIDVVNFLKMYAGTNVLADGPIWQYIQYPQIYVVF